MCMRHRAVDQAAEVMIPLPLPPGPLPCAGLRLLRLEHGLEVDLGEQDRREARARAHVGDDRAQVRIEDLRAHHADHALHLFVRQVADLEDAGLLGLDQEQRAVLDLGRHGGGDADLVDAFVDVLGRQRQVDVDLRLLLLEQDLRRVGLLQRQVLQVQALDLEHGVRVGFGHGEGFREMKRPAVGAGRRWVRAGWRLSPTAAAALPARLPWSGLRPASNGIRPPRWSSAISSSQPPTWVSPMKICGTVRRPVSSIMRSALFGVEVDPHLVDLRHAALAQQRLGPNAERAHLRGVHAHWFHPLRGLCGPTQRLERRPLSPHAQDPAGAGS